MYVTFKFIKGKSGKVQLYIQAIYKLHNPERTPKPPAKVGIVPSQGRWLLKLVFSPQDGTGVPLYSHPFFNFNIIALLAKDCQTIKAINIFLVYSFKINMYKRI
jgi:hypothetical protein